MASKRSRQDCIDDIVKATGKTRRQVEEELDDIDARAQGYGEGGADAADVFARARDEKLAELTEQAALARRERIMNARKDIRRVRFYSDVAAAIDKLPVSDRIKARLTKGAARIALEAKLVGVNLPFAKNRYSVDAQYVALRRLWVGGLARDLEDQGLLKIFARRELEDKWTAELFELNKRPSAAWSDADARGDTRAADELGWRGQGPGNPGITKDKQALAIATAIQKWQKTSVSALNREGAWIRSYSGYITRTSHDPDKIRLAGQEKWIADTIPLLDLPRTFGTRDLQHARDTLRAMWRPMMQGDHFDHGKPIEDPIYPNPAKTASASRELHFNSGTDWRAYNEKYGVHNATRTVIEALVRSARRTALMKEFGTRPAEAFENDIEMLKAQLQKAIDARSSRLSALEQARSSAGADAAALAKIDKDMAGLKEQIAQRAGDFEDFRKFVGQERYWGSPAHNRFAQIDGTSMKPVNRTGAQLANNWMAIQRMAKLGRVALTHFASLPTKAAEARYWGIPFAERYGSLVRGLTQGAEGSAKREALDATLVAFENRLGHMMAIYDVADAPAGFLAKWETRFFQLTGVSSVIDNQRGDAEAMFASWIGSKRKLDWEKIGSKEQRVLTGFGIGAPEWKALKGVEWSRFGERTSLTAQDAMKLSDAQVAAYLKEARPREFANTKPSAEDVATGREDLALALAAAYSDRAGYAIPMPSARIRAIMFQNAFQPGTGLNIAMRLIYQFKLWPADMVTRAWGREMYGTIGDTRMDKFAGLAEFAVGSIVFGVASETVRELLQGKDALHTLATQPIAAILRGAERSGMGSLLGDYLLGAYDRHGLSAVAQLAGPTVSQLDTLLGILHGQGDSLLNAVAGIKVEGRDQRVREPWKSRLTDLTKLVKDNTPFQSLWLTSTATDALIWHRLQEWINPGYLQRAQRRQEQQNGTKYWVSPAATDRWLTGQGPAPKISLPGG
jgi:hypothetical protein